MKIHSSAILALSLLQAAEMSAFVIQTPQKTLKPSVALRSSYRPGDEIREAGQSSPGRQQGPSPPLTSPNAPPLPVRDDMAVANIWETATPVRVEGDSLRTWQVEPQVEFMQVSMKTEGRPLNANLELWHGPNYTPSKIGVYIEDGDLRPFNALVATPMALNTIAIYNTGQMEFPFTACAQGEDVPSPRGLSAAPRVLEEMSRPKTIQGGMVSTYPFLPHVESVQILMKTDGRHLQARIELLQGPNNYKQVLEVYSSDGLKRPFFAVLETPGTGNVVRIANQNPVEYPILACVEPYMVAEPGSEENVVVVSDEVGSGSGWESRLF